ncbi:MAG: DNA repair protein RecO [SAR324 cluster bacterium]|nr:DNA repair protein RecO [SAR324 cluster bacterium]
MDFKENDKIITFLTRDEGKKSGIVKGAKKINSQNVGISEPFTQVRIFYVESPRAELVRVRKFELIDSFYPIRQGYDKILYATYFTELIHLCIIDPQESPRFFHILVSALHALQGPNSLAQTKIIFEKNLFAILGISPNLERCIKCRCDLWQISLGKLPKLVQIETHQLDCVEGGIRCPKCLIRLSTTSDLSPGTLSFLRYLEEHNDLMIRATSQNIDELNAAFLTYFQNQIGKTPKSHVMLKH